MGPRIREELGRLRLDDLLREADERSKHDVRRRSTRRPSPRTGGEADEMDLTPYLDAVRADLEAVSGSDEATSAVAERLARALEPSLQLRLLDALGQAAQELSEQLPNGRVDVRLSGRDVDLVAVFDEAPAEPIAAEDDGGTARITLRLPESTKTRVERAASGEGISTNSWLVRAVARGLEQEQQQQRRRRVGNRITGLAQS